MKQSNHWGSQGCCGERTCGRHEACVRVYKGQQLWDQDSGHPECSRGYPHIHLDLTFLICIYSSQVNISICSRSVDANRQLMSSEYMNLPWNIFPRKTNITGLSITMVTSLPKAACCWVLFFPLVFWKNPPLDGWLTGASGSQGGSCSTADDRPRTWGLGHRAPHFSEWQVRGGPPASCPVSQASLHSPAHGRVQTPFLLVPLAGHFTIWNNSRSEVTWTKDKCIVNLGTSSSSCPLTASWSPDLPAQDSVFTIVTTTLPLA